MTEVKFPNELLKNIRDREVSSSKILGCGSNRSADFFWRVLLILIYDFSQTASTWTYFTPCSSVSIVNFEHVIAGLVDLWMHTKNWLTLLKSLKRNVFACYSESDELCGIITKWYFCIFLKLRVCLNMFTQN